jgi:hypothetical protein
LGELWADEGGAAGAAIDVVDGVEGWITGWGGLRIAVTGGEFEPFMGGNVTGEFGSSFLASPARLRKRRLKRLIPPSSCLSSDNQAILRFPAVQFPLKE